MRERGIDYLQFSQSKLPAWLGDKAKVEKSNMRFYTHMMQYGDGTRAYYGNPNSDKVLIIMSGATVSKYSEDKLKEIINECREYDGKVSRVDFQITVEGRDALEKFCNAISERNYKSRRFEGDPNPYVGNAENGIMTQYVGDMKKRGKRGIFRAYNKGIESGLGIDLSRFELECRRSVANNNAKRYASGTTIGDIINASITIDASWWKGIMGSPKPLPQVAVEHEEYDLEPMAKRWLWLVETVAPSLGEALAWDEKNRQGIRQVFLDAVEKSYRKHGGESEIV